MLDFDTEQEQWQSVDLSRQIHERRTALGLPQTELGRRMHLHPSVPRLWEHGERLVPGNRIPALALALETDVQSLLSDEPSDAAAATVATIPVMARAREPEPDPEPAPEPKPAPSEVELLWCTSTHGARDRDGNPPPPRRHHHGPKHSWAPGFWTGD